MNNWSGKKKVFALFGAILAIVGLVVTIFLVQTVQDLRSRAAKATVLSLTPTNQNVEIGEEGELDVVVSPGTNQINFIKTSIKFDEDKFFLDEGSFSLNEELNFDLIEGPTVSDGVLSFIANVNDPTSVIQNTPVTLGNIRFIVKDEAESGDSQFSFDEANTQIKSLGSGDSFKENVLSSTVQATVTVGEAICKPNIATCSWEATEGNVSFKYVVTDTADDSVVEEGETDSTKIEFDSIPGHTYRCEVTAFNPCGESPEANGTSACPTPSPTPSVTPTPSPSPSPSPTPEVTPTPTEKVTPTPTTVVTPTPTLILTTVPSLPPQGSVTSTPAPGVSVTPAPTLPPTGNPLVIGGILGGVLFVLGGLALLFL